MAKMLPVHRLVQMDGHRSVVTLESGKPPLEITCPNCGNTFFRKDPSFPLRCPKCQALLKEPSKGYASKKKKLAIAAWRHVEKLMKRSGLWKKLRKMGYARDNTRDPKYVKSYFNEMKQHGVPFRTRMQFLSRVYGGRGGFTSEELYKIVRGRAPKGGSYYIFPFVKGAPPEVNRILEATYRRHREQGDTKTVAAIAAWNKVKQLGYVRKEKPAKVWVKEHKMQKYTLPREKALLKQLKRKYPSWGQRLLRGAGRFPKAHPRLALAGTSAALGAWGMRRIQKRRAKRAYAAPIGSGVKRLETAAKGTWEKVPWAVRKPTEAASALALVGLISYIGKTILEELRKKRLPVVGPYMPEVQPDIELMTRYSINQVTTYASEIPTGSLITLRDKVTEVLRSLKATGGRGARKVKAASERLMLGWFLGMITAELLGRGITTPKRRHIVPQPIPVREEYRRRKRWEGSYEPPPGFQEVGPKNWLGRVKPGSKLPGERGYRATPLWSKEEVKMLRGLKRRKLWAAAKPKLKTAGKIGVAAVPAVVIAEALRRRRYVEPYGLSGGTKHPIHATRKMRAVPRGGKLWRGTKAVSRGLGKAAHVGLWAWILSDLARAALPKKREAATLQPPRYYEQTEMYPFRSKAQRRWMHAVHPKMAEEWERHTPEDKKLPEHVSKHALWRRTPRSPFSAPLGAPIFLKNLLSRLRAKHTLSLEKLKNLRKTGFYAPTRTAQVREEIKSVVAEAEEVQKSLRRMAQREGAVAAAGVGAAGIAGAGGYVTGKKAVKRKVEEAIK